jgi:O-antigen/teichoic acid export membrane protein
MKIFVGKCSDLLVDKFAKDSFVTLLSAALMIVCGLGMNFVIVNRTSASAFGIFSQVLALYLLAGLISTFGINQSLLKYIAECDDGNEGEAVITSALVLVSAFSLASASFFYVLIQYFPGCFPSVEVSSSFAVCLVAIPFFSVNKVLMGLLNGLREMSFFSVCRMIRCFLLLLFTILLLLIYGFKSVFWSFLLTETILFSVLIFFLRRKLSFEFLNLKEWSCRHVKFGFKSVLNSSVSELNTKLDILMIGYLVSDSAVGVYSFAAMIAKGILLLPSVVQINFNPVISRLFSIGKKDELQKKTNRITRVMMLVLPPFSILACISYPLILSLLAKDSAFGGSIPVFYILIAGSTVFGIFQFFGGAFAMSGLPGFQLAITLFYLILNFVLNLFFIQIYGIVGAAVATSTTYVISIITFRYLLLRKIGIRLF